MWDTYFSTVLYFLPKIFALVVGIVLAIANVLKNKNKSMMAGIGFALILLVTLLMPLHNVHVSQAIALGELSVSESVGARKMAAVIAMLFEGAAWAIILAAVFGWRKNLTSQTT